jgi:hypothetical protein
MQAISSRAGSVREPQISLGYLVGACALLTGCAADAGDLAASGGTNGAVEVGVAKSAVIDGVIANDSDDTGIVRLWAQNTKFNEFRQFCTGVLLRNNVVLTARHCVDQDQAARDNGWPDMRASLSSVVVSTGLFGAAALGVDAPPSFAPDGRDLAAFRLQVNLPIATGGRVVTTGFQHPLAHPFAGDPLLIAGYGSTTGSNATDICNYISLTTNERTKGCIDDPFQLSAAIGGTAIDGVRVLVTGVKASPGDSGGPVFAVTNASNVADLPLIGVNVFAEACLEDHTCGAVSMRVADIESWVLTR